MVRLGVRVLVWLLVVCVPAKASVAVSLRAMGPAHAHAEVPHEGQSMARATAASEADHAAWHAHEHWGSRAAHHDHDAADDSVILVADSSDDEHRAGGSASKASVLDMPSLPSSALSSPLALGGRDLNVAAPWAFDSVAAVPLYRPPR